MSDKPIDDRNPAGIKLTQAQIDESFRQGYWMFAIRYGLQYYATGRFATAHRLTPVCANLLHHAVELLLKACLSYTDSREAIEKYPYKRGGYGHDIRDLWAEFKKRQTAPVPAEFDAIVAALHAFEDIRYPEELILNGAAITINPFVEEPIQPNDKRPEPSYHLSLPPIDRLVGFLFKASQANPEFFQREITDQNGMGDVYYQKLKATLFGKSA